MNISKKLSIGQRLRYERERLNWSQEQLAEKIGTTALSINRWEHDKTLPRPYYRAELCGVFRKSGEELFDLQLHEVEESSASELPTIWNVPHLRNLYFTGRENILTYLHDTLTANKTVALTQPRVISGLGGIGKTQIAVEYAYRYGYEYKAVLWMRADYYKSLVSDFVACVDLLNLPEKGEADQNRMVAAVKRWLEKHSPWLLVLDNADDLEMIYDFLPPRGGGHILLTTRSQATGPNIKGIEIEKMGLEEGALLLLKRAKLLAEDVPLEAISEQKRGEAEAISALVDGLPLALDQAAAYIEENQCGLADYLRLYEARRADMLKRRGTFGKRDYPKSVATTWLLSFGQVQQANPIAADLLRLCAFLHPDAIPEALLMAGAGELGTDLQAVVIDPLLLNDAIATLRTYSLVRRNPETKMLTIHRLVQAVLKDAMSRETQRQWAERVVRVVNRAFPHAPEQVEMWPICQQYLPHAQACTRLIEQWEMIFPEAAHILDRSGVYLYKRGRYTEAAFPLQHALVIREQILGGDHSDVANSLYHLANLYRDQANYEQAETFYQRALATWEQVLGFIHADVGHCLSNLGWLYYEQGKYERAEALYQRAISIEEQVLGPTHPDVAKCLDDLGLIYSAQNNYKQAELLMERALAIREQVLGSIHPDVAESLNDLAKVYSAQGKYEQAMPLMQRALETYEQTLGPNHRDVAASLNGLALLYGFQRNYEQAVPLMQRSLIIREQALGPNHHYVALSLNGLAWLYTGQGKYEQAEPLFQRALALFEQALGPKHFYITACLHNLAKLYHCQGKHEQEELLLWRALSISEQLFGLNNLEVATSLNALASFSVFQGKYEQAESLFQRALTIEEQNWGLKHPTLTATLVGYADLLRKMERESEAVSLEAKLLAQPRQQSRLV